MFQKLQIETPVFLNKHPLLSTNIYSKNKEKLPNRISYKHSKYLHHNRIPKIVERKQALFRAKYPHKGHSFPPFREQRRFLKQLFSAYLSLACGCNVTNLHDGSHTEPTVVNKSFRHASGSPYWYTSQNLLMTVSRAL